MRQSAIRTNKRKFHVPVEKGTSKMYKIKKEEQQEEKRPMMVYKAKMEGLRGEREQNLGKGAL